MRKYALVKHHDRVGRMTDILEYSDVAFPRDRFPRCAARRAARGRRLRSSRSTAIMCSIRHVYIERRLTPLNLHLERADADERARAVREYGDAIAAARGGEHLRRRPAVQELRRHALWPRHLLRLRRDRIPDGLHVPPHPAAAAGLRRDVARRLVSGRSARRLPGGVRDVPADRPGAARGFHARPREPARGGLVAAGSAGDPRWRRSRGAFVPTSAFASRRPRDRAATSRRRSASPLRRCKAKRRFAARRATVRSSRDRSAAVAHRSSQNAGAQRLCFTRSSAEHFEQQRAQASSAFQLATIGHRGQSRVP